MAIIHKINNYFKKKLNIFLSIEPKALRAKKFNPLIVVSFIIIFSGVFFISSNLINIKNENNKKNFTEVTKSNDFSNFTDFLISKINSLIRK